MIRVRAIIQAFFFLLIVSGCQPAVSTIPAASSKQDAASPFPAGAEVKIYLLAGQSNMAGRGKVGARDKVAHPRVFMLSKEGKWVPANEPLHFDKPKRIGVGPGLAFGKAMAEANPRSIIALVPTAVGGSVIASWKAGGYHAQTKVYPYDDSVKRAKLATASGGKLSAILWHQGEHDSRRDRMGRYAGELSRLAADFRRDLQAPGIPFVVGGLGDFLLKRNSDAHQVQSALEHVAETVPCAAFVSAKGLADKGDELHFSAASARRLGQRFAEKLQSPGAFKNCSSQ